jgi:hypothetical protein
VPLPIGVAGGNSARRENSAPCTSVRLGSASSPSAQKPLSQDRNCALAVRTTETQARTCRSRAVAPAADPLGITQAEVSPNIATAELPHLAHSAGTGPRDTERATVWR